MCDVRSLLAITVNISSYTSSGIDAADRLVRLEVCFVTCHKSDNGAKMSAETHGRTLT